jgi:predicted metal-dependent HD superfamily phosphohydrolase
MDPTLISPETYITTTFATLLQPFNPLPTTIQKWTSVLLSTYSEPHRYYHTTTHIYTMLQHFSSSLPIISNPTAVGLAIIFHDWEYIPHSPPRWNEEQSIVHFSGFAEELNLPAPLITTVKKYITATISHKLAEEDKEDEDLKLFLDFDLEVLGRERSEYIVYMRQIRREYNQFTDDMYWHGRKAVLERFLERDRLFFSEEFCEKFEETAKENLRWEVGALKGGGDGGEMAKLMGDGI